MEGRPPFDDDADDLDFDFEATRRDRLERETGERPAVDPDEGAPGEAEGAADESRPRRSRGGGIRLPRGIGRARRRSGRRPARESAASTTAPTDTGEHRRLRDDPYTPAEVPVPGERRSRRRDLPAKVRRRQAIALGVVALVAVLGIVVLANALFGGDDGEDELPLKKLAGQSVIARLTEAGPDQKLIRRVRKGQIGGVIATPRNETTLNQHLGILNQAAADGDNPPLLVMIDQEGGSVKRLENGPPDQSPAELGRDGDPEAARTEGDATGAYLKPIGVNVDLAPVLDIEFPQSADSIGDRTFSDDPAVVSELGTAFIEGLQGQGVAATAKHFPGLGPATVNTDFSVVTIAARAEQLDAGLQPFQSAIDAGVDLVMVSSAIYPAYGPERPAAFVAPIVQGQLRDQLGFEGVVITDDLQSVAIEELTNPAEAAVSALGAGCDLLLYAGGARGSVQGFNGVVRALKDGTLTREQVQESYDRIQELKGKVAAPADG